MAVIAKADVLDALLESAEMRAALLAYDRSGHYADFQRALHIMDLRRGLAAEGGHDGTSGEIRMLKAGAARRPHLTRLAVCMVLFAALSSCASGPHARLTRAERVACSAEGGFESRSAFGYPLCQVAYADGGKACTGKSDCQGRCFSETPEQPRTVGAPAVGQCQANRYEPGCHAVVEGGRLATPDICED